MRNRPALLLLLVFGMWGCEGLSGSPFIGAKWQFPKIAPLVDGAAPLGLQSGMRTTFAPSPSRLLERLLRFFEPKPLFANMAQVGNLRGLFKGIFSPLSKESHVGFINAGLETLDMSMQEILDRFQGREPLCLGAKALPKTFSLSFVNPVFELSGQFQCREMWTPSTQVANGSGIAFGQSPQKDQVSVLLRLNHSTTTGFGLLAHVTGLGTKDEAVDVLYTERGRIGNSTQTFGGAYRLKVLTHVKHFELVLVSNAPNFGASQNNEDATLLGCGFHLIADGSTVFAKGSFGDSCQQAVPFELCMDPSLEMKPVSMCENLGASFLTGTVQEINQISSEQFGTIVESQVFHALSLSQLEDVTMEMLAP